MTPFLDQWICSRAGFACTGRPGDRDRLASFQIAALGRTLAHAAGQSRFYKERLAGVGPDDICSLGDLSDLPFTWPADLHKGCGRFACVSQDAVARRVTLETSGTTDRPKRLIFTLQDLEMTVDFFAACLGTLMGPDDRGMICLPGATPASAGDLIRQAMDRIGARPQVHGLVADAGETAEKIREIRPRVLIGMPVQVLALAEILAEKEGGQIPWIILTADHVSASAAHRIQRGLNGRVLSHYGMTETGFGGAIQCSAGEGLHIRHPHLVVEIVDPESGHVLPHGAWGEIVVTTLDRRAMPLIRYRTGDVSRILDAPCACGSPFPRLDRIRNRQVEAICLGAGLSLTMADLDDALFALDGVVDFSAGIHQGTGPPELSLIVETLGPVSAEMIKEGLEDSAMVKKAIDRGRLGLGNIKVRGPALAPSYTGKRLIRDLACNKGDP